MLRARHFLLVATFVLSAGSVPAALMTETFATVHPPEGGGDMDCHKIGNSFSHCEVVDATGLYGAETTAQARYGFLSVEYQLTSASDLWWSWTSSEARFSDMITLSRPASYAEAAWDTSDLVCEDFCDIFGAFFERQIPVTGNALSLHARIGAGSGPSPEDAPAHLSGSLRLLSIRLFDELGEPLTGPISFSSQSGARYNIEGATQVQVPEPNSALTAAIAFFLMLRQAWLPKRRLRIGLMAGRRHSIGRSPSM
jgi:hypothetical protein